MQALHHQLREEGRALCRFFQHEHGYWWPIQEVLHPPPEQNPRRYRPSTNIKRLEQRLHTSGKEWHIRSHTMLKLWQQLLNELSHSRLWWCPESNLTPAQLDWSTFHQQIDLHDPQWHEKLASLRTHAWDHVIDWFSELYAQARPEMKRLNHWATQLLEEEKTRHDSKTDRLA